MNRTDMVNKLAEHARVSKEIAKTCVDGIFDAQKGILAKAMKRGDKISLVGFGSFEGRTRAARTARNPRTGETIEVEAHLAPNFKPGKGLKEHLKKAKVKTKK